MKRIHYLSKLKSSKKEKEPVVKILIPMGTEIFVTKVTKYVPINIRKDLEVKVLVDDGIRYTFKLPKSEKLSYVLKDKVTIIQS